MWQAPSLPYYCDAKSLPAPLPPTKEIHRQGKLLKDGTLKVVQYDQNYVIKYSGAKDLIRTEGINLIFVNENLKVRTPKIYALYEEMDVMYIVMEWIRGHTLNEAWQHMDRNDKTLVMGKLKGMIDGMRSLPPPTPPFFGSVDGGPMPDELWWRYDGNPSITGPFKTSEQLIRGLADNIYDLNASNNNDTTRAEWYQNNVPQLFANMQPTFTHGDIQRKNILFYPKTKDLSNPDDFELTLIDWENAGWYPEFYEYFTVYLTAMFVSDDWHKWMETAMQFYPLEASRFLDLYEDMTYKIRMLGWTFTEAP